MNLKINKLQTLAKLLESNASHAMLFFVTVCCACLHTVPLGDKRTTQTQNERTRYVYTRFFDASKIAYRIRVCAFVIHNHNFAFPVLFAEQKNKLRDCRQVENLHMVCGFDYCQFQSANAADESIHRA